MSIVRRPSLAGALLAAAIPLVAPSLPAQSGTPPDSTAERTRAARPLRVGVVLSGGGAKGLAHIGVLEGLEEAGVPIDIVTGTSMGGTVGGLYAIGYSSAGLEHIVASLDWSHYFQDAPQHELLGVERRLRGDRTVVRFPVSHGRIGLPSGVIAGQRVSALLSRLTWPAQTARDFRRFPTPFTAVATDLATRDVVVLDSGSLAENLRATMSLPGLFTPVELNGRLLTDGGIARNLPAQEARRLGADLMVCSDVSDELVPSTELRSLVDVLMQTITFQIYASTAEQRRLCDVYLRPELAGLDPRSFDRAAKWAARGAEATRAALPQLREIARRAGARPPSRRPEWTSPPAAPVRVHDVVVHGVPLRMARLVRRALGLTPGASVTPDDVEAAIDRVYATGWFERVTYRLDLAGTAAAADVGSGDTPAVDVVVTASAANQDQLGFGFRFDDRYKASLLFTLGLRNRIAFGSTTELDVRLGEQLRFGARFVRAGVASSRLAVGGMGSYEHTPIDIYVDGQRVAETDVEVTGIGALLGATVGTSVLAGLRLKGEHASAVSAIAQRDTGASATYASVAAVVWRETLDRAAYPSRGTALYAKAEHADGEARFSHLVADARGVLPVSTTVSLVGRAMAGAARGGSEVPLHYRFFLGGVNTSPLFPETQISFAGFRPQELAGAAAARLGAAVQWEPRRRLFATFRLDTGNAAERLGDVFDDFRTGGALTLGTSTPFGPVELSATGRNFGELPRLELSVGFVF